MTMVRTPVVQAINNKQDEESFRVQQALRMASRGPNAVWLHLLFPLSLLFGTALFIGLPLLLAIIASPPFAENALKYLDWCVPLCVAGTLTFNHWARGRLLKPYLEQVANLPEKKKTDTEQ
ncbi:hypothetical protein [Pseudohongiella sp. O18]|uniref:hypothetical protein n=1 Tax=Pseudohongiella sp. O18 TaxID=2904248 RepID=UPI001F3F1972|nr:hypothetical protein [Pseudohongiella sp. O18]